MLSMSHTVRILLIVYNMFNRNQMAIAVTTDLILTDFGTDTSSSTFLR